MFQSLIGINNKWNFNITIKQYIKNKFQSLIGINNKWNPVIAQNLQECSGGFNP